MHTHWRGYGEEGGKEENMKKLKMMTEEKEDEGDRKGWRKTGDGGDASVLSYIENGEYSGSTALTEDQTKSYLKPAV